MAQKERDPLDEMLGVQKRLNNLFENALTRTEFEAHGGLEYWTPVADIFAADDTFQVFLELPGLQQDQIELRIDGEQLVVEGERRAEREADGRRFHRVERSSGRFMRRIDLPADADRDQIDAAFENGLLQVTLPRTRNPKPGPIRVKIR
ncbi:MAG: Hsp20/alpha crystallin family protein [Acidobacteriota bacterium]|nr:Hsp20/alpha crystallin family protein [Acidobacteriota bacterium]MDH3785714.1 Hsp20/alpha crystallin family protein [Acidobacteriota bacterium]